MTGPARGGGLDWSSRGPNGAATLGPLAPCIHCGQDAMLRHPITGRPCHKVCAETAEPASAPVVQTLPGAGGCADLAEQAGITTIRHRHSAGPGQDRTHEGLLTQTHLSGSGLRPRDPRLAAALRYAEHGWPVFMLGRSKRPVANCPACPKAEVDPSHDQDECPCLTCHGFYAASTDPERVAAIVAAVPSGQLALRTGAASGLVVVDVDPAHDGAATLGRLIAAGLTPPTARVRTGSGGLHLYYRHPGRHIPCSQGKPGQGLGPGIDVKADGGYVVLPPSVHPRTGRPYQWIPGQAIREMPPALITACLPPPATPIPAVTGPTPVRKARGISHPDRLLAALLDRVTTAPEGARRTTLYGTARGVARMIRADAIDKGNAIAALTDAGRQAEQTDRDIRAAIRGGFRAEGVAA